VGTPGAPGRMPGWMLLRGGTVVDGDGARQADVLVGGGRIAAVGAGLDAAGAGVVDVGGAYVIPGAIDVHTHMALPVGAVRSADDFESGTLAAACGGTTCIVDFAGAGREPWQEALAITAPMRTCASPAGPRSPSAGAGSSPPQANQPTPYPDGDVTSPARRCGKPRHAIARPRHRRTGQALHRRQGMPASCISERPPAMGGCRRSRRRCLRAVPPGTRHRHLPHQGRRQRRHSC
jgi:hypothetical protein